MIDLWHSSVGQSLGSEKKGGAGGVMKFALAALILVLGCASAAQQAPLIDQTVAGQATLPSAPTTSGASAPAASQQNVTPPAATVPAAASQTETLPAAPTPSGTGSYDATGPYGSTVFSTTGNSSSIIPTSPIPTFTIPAMPIPSAAIPSPLVPSSPIPPSSVPSAAIASSPIPSLAIPSSPIPSSPIP